MASLPPTVTIPTDNADITGLVNMHHEAVSRAATSVETLERALALKVSERDWPGVAALAAELASYDAAQNAHEAGEIAAANRMPSITMSISEVADRALDAIVRIGAFIPRPKPRRKTKGGKAKRRR